MTTLNIMLMAFGIKKNIYVIFYFILLTSCYREETIYPPVCEHCTKLVVLCFIGPSDTIRAFITKTYPFSKIQSVNNDEFKGEIYISDSIGNITRLKNSPTNPRWFYASQKNLQIIPGGLYKMTVIDEKGIVSTAVTSVPKTPDKWQYCKIIGSQEEDDGLTYLIKLVWKKNSKTNNMIGFGEYDIYENKIINTTVEFDLKISYEDSSKFEYLYSQYWRYKYFFTLYTIDKPFESFLKSYYLFNKIGMDLQTNGITEMFNGLIPEYTNFDNCLGVFGAYLTDTISVTNQYPSP